MLVQEIAFLLFTDIHVRHLNTFFLRAPMVVLGLYLHKLQTTDAVGAEAYLLAVGVVPLVLVVHVERSRVKVRRIVLQIALSVNLRAISRSRHRRSVVVTNFVSVRFISFTLLICSKEMGANASICLLIIIACLF